MGSKSQKYHLRREEIIDQAARIFQEKGYKSATLKDVADRLEITAPAVYYHFHSKQEILYEIFQRTMRLGLDSMNRIAENSMNPKDKLRLVIEEYTALVANNLDFFTVFFQDKYELSQDHTELITAREREFIGILRNIYSQGVKTNDFVDLDPVLVVNGILGMCSWLYKWFKPGRKYNVEEVSRHFNQMILGGLEKK